MPKKIHDRPAGASRTSARPLEEPEPGRPSGLLRTADVLEETGITHQVLYRYITLGLIEPRVTTGTGLRFFHPNVVTLIKLIIRFNQSGYSLRDMKDIFFKDKRVKRAMSAE